MKKIAIMCAFGLVLSGCCMECKQKQTEQDYMNTEKSIIGYRDPEFKIKNTYDVRGYNIMQEHSMIFTEPEDIGCKIKKCKSKKGYSAEI